MTFRPCAIVPSRNHYRAIAGIVDRLRAEGLPVLVVDDGSAEPARAALAELHAPESRVTVLRLDSSRGKGGAVIEGFERAAAGRFSHAIQIDADGQHDLTALPDLLASSSRHPDALILGSPVFDRSIPKSRKIGRWLTHVWVCVETLSPRVIDSMCGFRVYPLAPVMSLLARERLAQGMDFDIDVFVRLRWRGVPVATVPVRIVYPESNLSNFDLVRDNWLITKTHTRLVLTMLVRLRSIQRRCRWVA
jgi:glycosyltransferase involved in cell wall biosynthesis